MDRMQREEASSQEVFSYAQMSTLERNSGLGTLSRHVERERLERDSYTVDVRASDLQLDKPGPLHRCFSYRVWLYSVVIGVRTFWLLRLKDVTFFAFKMFFNLSLTPRVVC